MSPSGNWPFDDRDSERRFAELMRKLLGWAYGGVAFFGAGTSVPAGLPTWLEFHEKFLEHFGANPPPPGGDSFATMRNDVDYHVNRDGTKALTFIQSTFGGTVLATPPVVKLAREARSLRLFYTTNFDEVLAAAAARKPVAVYPEYVPVEAQFVYLHGRAATAKSVHGDLVLGETGYQRAYGDATLALARAKLQVLVGYPIVFLGFSMTDPMVMQTLTQMADAVRRRQEFSAGGQRSEAISLLDWYAVLKAPPEADLGRDARKGDFERGLADAGAQAIWYCDGGADQHRALLNVVQRIQRESRGLTVAEEEPGFVESLLEAEALTAELSPTPNDVRRAAALLRGQPRVAAAFMDRVDGPEWFRHLRDGGELHPTPSVTTTGGARSAPYWLAADFLRRIASVAPAEVKDFMLSVDTDNWVAIRQAFNILESLDEDSAVALAERFAKWLVDAMPADSLLLYQAALTSQRLESSDKHEAALALAAAALIELASSSVGLTEGSSAQFSLAVVPILAQSKYGLDAAIDALGASLDHRFGAPDQDSLRYTRPAIERRRASLPDHSVVGLLIDVVRDTLLETKDAAFRASAVDQLLQSPWPTKRRVGIAHCFLQRSDLPGHEALIVTRENLEDPSLFHELAKLISDDAMDLSRSAALVVQSFVANLRQGPSESGRDEYDLWARILPHDWLPEPPSADGSDDDDPDRRLFRDLYFSGVFLATAPLDQVSFSERAEALTATELLALVRDPAGAGVRVTWRHDAEEMWMLLAGYVREQDLLAPLLAMEPEDLGGNRGSWRAVEAMPDVAGDSLQRWEEILNWAEHMATEATADGFWALGLLLEKTGRTAPLVFTGRISTLAIRVIERTMRSSSVDSEFPEESMISGFLNRPAGTATQALFELLRRELVERETATGAQAPVPLWFRETVLTPVARDAVHLGIDAWIGLGRYYPYLCERSPDTVDFVASHLESQTSTLSTTATAFWSGYLWAPLVSSVALNRLLGVYRAHAVALQAEDAIDADLRGAFFQHVVIGVLRELPGFGEALTDSLDEAFTSEARGAIASALGRGVEEASDDPDTPFHSLATEEFRRYWARHVESFGGQDGDQLAKYLDWLRDLQLRPGEIADLVEASLDQATSGASARHVFDYLQRFVEEDPSGVLRLLSRCIEWWRLHGDFWLNDEEVGGLLDRLAPPVSPEEEFREVLDGFAELGAVSVADVRRLLSASLSDAD